MLDDGDSSFDYIFTNVDCYSVVFNGVILRIGTHIMHGSVKQITLGRLDFLDSPVGSAYIFGSSKLPVIVRNVAVDEFAVFIDSINRTCKRGVALRSAVLAVLLRYSHRKLLQDIIEVAGRNFIPKDRGSLIFGNNISLGCINFFKRVRRSATDKHILKRGNTVFIGNGILVHRNPRK